MVIFNFHGVKLEIYCQDPRHAEVLEWLKEDFSYFSVTELDGLAQIRIDIHTELKEKALFPFIRTKMCLTYGWFWERVCFYDSATILFQSFKKDLREAVIKSSDTELVYEILYTYVLSSVGEALEKTGFMRFHALGIEKGHKAKLYILPSLGGKSSLAYQIVKKTDLNIYSDEMVFTDGEKVLPFPIRIALNEASFDEVAGKAAKEGKRVFKRRKYENKFLLPVPNDRVASSHPLGTVHSRNVFYFLWVGFWGLGLPQMSEFLLRVPNLGFLIKMAYKRIVILSKILFAKKFRRLKKRRPQMEDVA